MIHAKKIIPYMRDLKVVYSLVLPELEVAVERTAAAVAREM